MAKPKNQTFLSKLYERMRELFSQGDSVSREQFEEAFKTARGHAGGKTSPNAAQMAAETDPTGVCVMLPVPAELAAQLATPGGLPPTDLHVTLCHLGTVDEISEVQRAEILLAVRDASLIAAPITATISGVGRFVGDEQDAIYLSVDSPALQDLYEIVEGELAECGYAPTEEHGFTPHITLAYIDPGASSPLETIEPQPITFDQLALWAGPARTALPLLGLGDDGDGDDDAAGLPANLQDALGADAQGNPTMSELADLAASGHTHRLFNSIAFAEAPDWIPYLPKPGTYAHPRYGEIVITRERNARFVTNFQRQVYQDRLPIDAEHETKLSGAVGWIVSMRQNSDGSADAKVEWTDRGRSFFADNRFRFFSPEWYDLWVRPETGAQIADVAIGGALTTRPFFKDPSLRPLFASEAGLLIDDPHTQGDPMAEQTFAELQQQLDALRAENAVLKSAGEQANAASTQMAERLAAIERERKAERFGALIRNDGARWFGEDAQHLSMLDTLASTFGETSDQFKAYVTQQKAVAAMLRTSSAFNELGGDGGGRGGETASAKIDRLAKERAKADGIDYIAAMAKVAAEQPDLYAEHSRAAYRRMED